MRVGQIGIAEGERAGAAEAAVPPSQGGRSHRPRQRAPCADDRYVVGAGNGHAHRTWHAAAMAVEQVEAERLDLGLARCQVLDGRVGHAVGPGHCAALAARVVDVSPHDGRQGAQRAGPRRHRAQAVRVGQASVAEGERASAAEAGVRRGQGHARHHARQAPADEDGGRMAGAGDRYRDGSRFDVAGSVGHGVAKVICRGLALRQVIVEAGRWRVNELGCWHACGVGVRRCELHSAMRRIRVSQAFDQVRHGVIGQHIDRQTRCICGGRHRVVDEGDLMICRIKRHPVNRYLQLLDG